MLMGTLSGIEMGLDLAKVPHRSGGVLAAMEVLKGRDVRADAEGGRCLRARINRYAPRLRCAPRNLSFLQEQKECAMNAPVQLRPKTCSMSSRTASRG